MGSTRVAVAGTGQTAYAAKRQDVSIAGLLREAAQEALDDAGMDWADIDAVVVGKAPDMFEGLMMPELYLADALGAAGKPLLRVHTAGSVGGSTAVVATHHVSSGRFDRVLTVAWEKQSESNAMWALSVKAPFGQQAVAGAGGFFAPIVRGYIQRSGAPLDTGYKVAFKDRRNALKNPKAHLKDPDLTYEAVANSPMLWDPIRYHETCPSSDGAAAMVLVSESHADTMGDHPLAWVRGTSVRSEPTIGAGRDRVAPWAASECSDDVYRQAGITDPRSQLDCAELYVPFSWFEPMWLESHGIAPKHEGWKLTQDGVTALDGDFPVNMSGGVLSSNPIGASGMIRFLEVADQVRGRCGEHQVDGARLALGQAYGGGSQFFATWVVGSDRP